jgi:hypothetical protein
MAKVFISIQLIQDDDKTLLGKLKGVFEDFGCYPTLTPFTYYHDAIDPWHMSTFHQVFWAVSDAHSGTGRAVEMFVHVQRSSSCPDKEAAFRVSQGYSW